jgi:hypothetical protein
MYINCKQNVVKTYFVYFQARVEGRRKEFVVSCLLEPQNKQTLVVQPNHQVEGELKVEYAEPSLRKPSKSMAWTSCTVRPYSALPLKVGHNCKCTSKPSKTLYKIHCYLIFFSPFLFPILCLII